MNGQVDTLIKRIKLLLDEIPQAAKGTPQIYDEHNCNCKYYRRQKDTTLWECPIHGVIEITGKWED